MTTTIKARSGLRIGSYCVLGQYVDLDHPATIDIQLRNARITYREHDHDLGQAVDLRVYDWKPQKFVDDEEIVDWLVLYSPEVRMHSSIILMRGYLHTVRLDRKRVGDHLGPDIPMRRATLRLRPEAALNDLGEWLEDRRPEAS
jgi:hypothetical protein